MCIFTEINILISVLIGNVFSTLRNQFTKAVPYIVLFLKASLLPEVLDSKYEGSCLEGNILIS